MYHFSVQVRACFRHTIIGAYLLVTVLAFVYTMTGWRPGLIWPAVHFSYGMMAPYQGFETYAQELLVEGQDEAGEWQSIDMSLYWPFLRGERVVRGWLMSWQRAYFQQDPLPHYRLMAEKLQRLEAEQGRTYQNLRMSWQTWPASPGGYYFLRREPFVSGTPILRWP